MFCNPTYRTNKSLGTKPFPRNHFARNWQEQRTWLQFDSLCQNANIKFRTQQTLRNMKHARNSESGWEWLQHLEYPSAGGGRGVAQGAQKIFRTQVCPWRSFYTSYVAFSSETVINLIMHKQTLPSSPKHFGTFAAGVLLGDKGLFPFFEPETEPD